MATMNQWVEGARPRTLPAAISPVLAGTAAAAHLGGFTWAGCLLSLGVALALQVGVNYSNDYSDGIRGTDQDRVGPFRLTGSGAAKPSAVKAAAFACFGVAAVLGIILVVLTHHWWLLAVGAAAILAAWYYTGGKRPYGYAGLGELFVFVFFGLVAVMGTTYVQAGRMDWVSALLAVAIGFYACAILVANNLRDIPTDAQAGKNTLAVRMGDAASRALYLALMALPPVLALAIALFAPHHKFMYAAVIFPALATIGPSTTVQRGAKGLDLIPVLKHTGLIELIYAGLVLTGLATTRG